MDEAIREKHAWFKAYSVLRKGGMTAEAKGAKTAYIDANMWQSMPSGWQSLKQSKRYSPQ